MPTGGSSKTPAALLKEYEKSGKLPPVMSGFDRLVFAVVSDLHDPLEAMKAIERVEANFIDWNECRVSRWVEIAKSLDPLAQSDKTAMRLRDMLNRLFDLRGNLSLDFCTELKVTEARKALSELDPTLSKQQINLILFEFHPAMTIPVSNESIDMARKHKLIPATGDKGHLQKKLVKLDHQETLKLLHYFEMEALAQKNPVSEKSSDKKAVKRKKVTKKVNN